MIGSREFKVNVKVNWILSIIGAGLVLIFGYIFRPEWREQLKFIAPVVGGTAALIAAVNAIDARGAQAASAKRQLALEFVHCWLNPAFYYAKKSGREILTKFKDLPTAEQQTAYLKEESTREANLTDVLNLFEALAIVLEMELIDEAICKRYFRSIASSYWHAAEPYIRKRRAERENPRLFQELEWLAKRWSS